MNPRLGLLQPYPFERLRSLLGATTPPANLRPISLGLGEPQHPTPALVKDALAANLGALARYPVTLGLAELREAIAEWLARRHGIPKPDANKQVIPVNGSREALFSIAQAVLDPDERDALVAIPNPFYQIYEGSTLLAGAKPLFINAPAASQLRPDWNAISEAEWKRVRMMYVCSPSNPHGRVMTLDDWKRVFELSDRHGFVVVSDECYSEIYFDEAKPPLGALAAARQLGRDRFERLVMFTSLSKRSNAPGMRSGFVAGDAALLKQFLLYRTYHGSAMSIAVQRASIAAWGDEGHVRDNRRLYAQKFEATLALLGKPLTADKPQGGFYLWLRTPIDDTVFARRLHEQYN